MTTDIPRFDDREDVLWADGPFDDGGIARTRGEPLANNPHERPMWAWKSWGAGWCDMDAGFASEDYERFKDSL